MYLDYERWAEMSREAYSIDVSWIRGLKVRADGDVVSYDVEFSEYVISGMGGSGIVGDIVRDVLEPIIDKPVHVVKDVRIPRHLLRRDVLVIAVSFSGDTIETLMCASQCISSRVPVVGVTRGGRLADMLRGRSLPVIIVPEATAPRYGLPCLLYPVLKIVQLYEEAARRVNVDLSISAQSDALSRADLAKRIADGLHNKIPLIYVPRPMSSVGYRFKNDLNENAKMPAIVAVLPESEHNDVAVHARRLEAVAPVLIYSTSLDREYVDHVNAVKDMLVNYRHDFVELRLEHGDLLADIMYAVTLLGIVSLELARANNVDPLDIRPISFIKSRISGRAL